MFLLLAACTAPPSETTDDGDPSGADSGPADTGEAGPTGPDIPDPALTAVEVGEALEEALT